MFLQKILHSVLHPSLQCVLMVIDNLSATLRTKLHQRLDYTVHTLVTGNRAEDMIYRSISFSFSQLWRPFLLFWQLEKKSLLVAFIYWHQIGAEVIIE
jgi:hypothetical protein